VSELVRLFDLFDSDDISLVFLDINGDSSTSQGRLVRHVMAAFTDYESDVSQTTRGRNYRHAMSTSYIEPGSPWENLFVESFGSRMRDEVPSTEQFDTLIEAQVLIGDWKHDYNNYRLHSSLGWRSPVAYATPWKAENQLDRLS
jgi:transposase InsO family protein